MFWSCSRVVFNSHMCTQLLKLFSCHKYSQCKFLLAYSSVFRCGPPVVPQNKCWTFCLSRVDGWVNCCGSALSFTLPPTCSGQPGPAQRKPPTSGTHNIVVIITYTTDCRCSCSTDSDLQHPLLFTSLNMNIYIT